MMCHKLIYTLIHSSNQIIARNLIISHPSNICLQLKFFFAHSARLVKSPVQFFDRMGEPCAARDWCIEPLKTKSNPVPNLSEHLFYLVELIASNHMLVYMAFGGDPSDNHHPSNSRRHKTQDRCPEIAHYYGTDIDLTDSLQLTLPNCMA